MGTNEWVKEEQSSEKIMIGTWKNLLINTWLHSIYWLNVIRFTNPNQNEVKWIENSVNHLHTCVFIHRQYYPIAIHQKRKKREDIF